MSGTAQANVHLVGYIDNDGLKWFISYFSINTQDLSTYSVCNDLRLAYEFPDKDTAMHFGHVLWNLSHKDFNDEERRMRVFTWDEAAND